MKFLLLIVYIMISSSSSAQIRNRLDSIISRSIQSGEPGIALYIETNGRTIYKKGVGLADLNGNSSRSFLRQ